MSDDKEVQEGVVLRGYSEEELSPEKLLNHSQNIRRQVTAEMTKSGIPTDEDTLKLLMGVLRDMDHTSIQSQKVDVDRDGIENDRAAQEIVKKLSMVNPYGLRVEPGQEVDRIPEPDPSEIPNLSFSEEEKEQGLSNSRSKDFLEEMEGPSEDNE
tara:strand:- start:2044 stop:2508 length:465 start_codon:yes stop_codon:yes gene_type:complete